MKFLALLISTCGLAACSTEDVIQTGLELLSGPYILNGSPTITDAQVTELLELTAREAAGLDLSVVRVVVLDTYEEAAERCGPGVSACASPPSKLDGTVTVIAPWDLTPSNWPASDSTRRMAAGNFVHELCHALHFQDGGDGDPNHADKPCFGEPEPSGRYGGSSPDNPTVYDRVSAAFKP